MSKATPVEVPAKPLTVPKVAKRLGIAPSTVRRAIRDGELKTIRFRKRVFVRLEDLEAYMSGNPAA